MQRGGYKKLNTPPPNSNNPKESRKEKQIQNQQG
jgi:hypothetical protein